MNIEHKISVIVAIIGLIGTIGGAIIGTKWGKENVNVLVEVNGESIVLKNEDVRELALENEDLKEQISDYEQQIKKLENERNDITIQLENMEEELGEIPVIEFHDLGLSIDGEEKMNNRDKAMAYINGIQYYSKDFVDNLLPENEVATIRDDMLYIGKIVSKKTNLFDRPVVETCNDCIFHDSIKDTYGNMYGNALVFAYNDRFTTFNANREYSYLKCTVAMHDGYKGQGVLQIKADNEVIYTSSEIINMTEPFEIDIPINKASIISIGTIGEIGTSRIFIANAILYNQE